MPSLIPPIVVDLPNEEVEEEDEEELEEELEEEQADENPIRVTLVCVCLCINDNGCASVKDTIGDQIVVDVIDESEA